MIMIISIFVFIFIIFLECLNITFKKSWCIISVQGRYKAWKWHRNWLWVRETCQNQGGDLVSIETEQEWNFINDQIQRRNTAHYENKWSIGLTKRPVIGLGWMEDRWLFARGEHDAAFMYKRDVFGGVNDTIRGYPHAYICEISKGKLLFLLLLLLFCFVCYVCFLFLNIIFE